MSKAQKKADDWYSKWMRVEKSFEIGGEYYDRCISCNKIMTLKQAQCGHFVGRSDYIHRYNHLNTWPQCGVCNGLRSGTSIHDYRENLEKKIGVEAVQHIVDTRKDFCKISRSDYEEIASKYKVLFLNLCADKGIIPW